MIKRLMICLFTGILLGTVLMYPAATKAKPQTIQPFGKNSFDVVTAKLDPGGNVYLYVGAERVMKSMDELAAKLHEMIAKEVSGPDSKDTDILKMFDLIYDMIKNSGLMEISGLGVSSIPMDADLNHSKVIIHHYQELNNGVIWKLFEAQPHELAQLKMLPANTVVASFSDFKLKTLWEWLKKEAVASDLPKFKETIMSIEPMLLQKGIPLETILNSIDSIGYIVTLDSTKKSIIPIGQPPLEIPEPAMALILSVKDDSLFNLIQSKLPFPQPADATTKKIQIPLPPLPVPVAPVIMQKDNLLIIASNNQLVDAMFTAKANGDGLIASTEFKKLSVNIPTEGNSYRFVSPRFFQAVVEIQRKGVELSKTQEYEKTGLMMFLNLLATKGLYSYGVLQNTNEGMIYTFNHTVNLETFFLLPITVPAALVAAIAVPNFITSMQRGKEKTTMADMETISKAIDAYIAEHKAAPEGNTLADIMNKLQPKYIEKLPLKDAWGNDFLYSRGTGAKKAEYAVASSGKDGVFNGWEQVGCYNAKNMKDFNNDLIITNGKFTYCPMLEAKTPEGCEMNAGKECEKKCDMKCLRKGEMKEEKKTGKGTEK